MTVSSTVLLKVFTKPQPLLRTGEVFGGSAVVGLGPPRRTGNLFNGPGTVSGCYGSTHTRTGSPVGAR